MSIPHFIGCRALCIVIGASAALAVHYSAAQEKADSQPAPPSPRNFAYAMERLKPLSVIEGGGDISPCDARTDESDRHADAVAYAQAMGSYALLIWKDGGCQLERYFDPFDRNTRPESASMHKSIVGLLVAAAIADGDIESADARVGDYIDEWSDDPRGDITVRQVLTMSSGLEPLSREGGTESEGMRFIMNPGNVRNVVLGRPLGHAPGTVFYYSGVNSQLLLMIIEAATGMDYIDYASKRLWQPIEAADAYVWDYAPASGMPRAHMSFLAPARDWLKIGLLLKDHGRYRDAQIIPAELIEEATSPGTANSNYGWQIWLGEEYQPARYYNEDRVGASVPMSEPFGVSDMIFFDGFGGQRVYVSREEDLVIVRQGDMRPDWDDAALPNLVLDASRE